MQLTNKMNTAELEHNKIITRLLLAELKNIVMGLTAIQDDAIKRGHMHIADKCEQDLQIITENLAQICEKHNIII